ncbi:MAG: hypothetical protein U0074_05115 [Kouleothrix sp.]
MPKLSPQHPLVLSKVFRATTGQSKVVRTISTLAVPQAGHCGRAASAAAIFAARSRRCQAHQKAIPTIEYFVGDVARRRGNHRLGESSLQASPATSLRTA